jgi:hypothetical protein
MYQDTSDSTESPFPPLPSRLPVSEEGDRGRELRQVGKPGNEEKRNGVEDAKEDEEAGADKFGVGPLAGADVGVLPD